MAGARSLARRIETKPYPIQYKPMVTNRDLIFLTVMIGQKGRGKWSWVGAVRAGGGSMWRW